MGYIGGNAGRCGMRQWCIVRNGRWSTVDGRKYAELNGGVSK